MSTPAIASPQNTRSSTSRSFNPEIYFRRIDYSGDLNPSLETLKSIHLLHAQSIPFENLDPLLRLPVQLDIDSIYNKLVLSGRGGYCFEHNLLLMHALKSIGFNVKGLAARVLWNIPQGIMTARGHMLLLVEIKEERFIADVGFGGLTLTAPLLLKPDIEQATPHEYFKLTQSGEDFVLQANVQQTWKRIYSFSMQENFLPDYEVTSWYLSNHPTSHFISGLIAALPFENGRYTLRNNEFAVHHRNGNTDKHEIANVSELKMLLQETFGIILPDVSEMDSTFKRILSPGDS